MIRISQFLIAIHKLAHLFYHLLCWIFYCLPGFEETLQTSRHLRQLPILVVSAGFAAAAAKPALTKKVYEITEAALNALRRWITTSTPPSTAIPDEFVITVNQVLSVDQEYRLPTDGHCCTYVQPNDWPLTCRKYGKWDRSHYIG